MCVCVCVCVCVCMCVLICVRKSVCGVLEFKYIDFGVWSVRDESIRVWVVGEYVCDNAL